MLGYAFKFPYKYWSRLKLSLGNINKKLSMKEMESYAFGRIGNILKNYPHQVHREKYIDTSSSNATQVCTSDDWHIIIFPRRKHEKQGNQGKAAK